MSLARGGNRRTKYHICPKCGQKKYYIRGNHLIGLSCYCQNCQFSNRSSFEVDKLLDEEDKRK